jgi:hypothetical protein
MFLFRAQSLGRCDEKQSTHPLFAPGFEKYATKTIAKLLTTLMKTLVMKRGLLKKFLRYSGETILFTSNTSIS